VSSLEALDSAYAFHTSGRFELLASEHVPFVKLGATDADGALLEAIASDEGVVCVLGISGAGKSSLIGSVTEDLPAHYVPLRIPVAAATQAMASIGGFSRHALERFSKLELDPLTKRHERAIQRALAVERTITRGRSGTVEATIGGGTPVLNAKLGGAFRLQAEEELKVATSDQTALQALQDTLDVLRGARLIPVLIVEDTDHWAATPEIASTFFDQVVRALSKGAPLDAITVVAVQPVHQRSTGYVGVRELLAFEIQVPRLPSPGTGLRVLLTSRIASVSGYGHAEEVFSSPALDLMAKAYLEDYSFRRTLSVARAALQQAVSDEAELIEAGHVQHGMAQYPALISA
jgi:hypothetical protein